VIVIDASAAVSALLRRGEAREMLTREQLHAPHLVDAEVASGVRRLTAAGRVRPRSARRVLHTWTRVGVTRYPMYGQLARVWELRDNVSAYDALYVALAERLGCPLVTADRRLSQAPGLRCALTLVPG